MDYDEYQEMYETAVDKARREAHLERWKEANRNVEETYIPWWVGLILATGLVLSALGIAWVVAKLLGTL